MKISRKMILRTAEELRAERGEFTQIDIHLTLQEKLGRELTPNEKRRITQILRNEYVVISITRDSQNNYIRIFFFF